MHTLQGNIALSKVLVSKEIKGWKLLFEHLLIFEAWLSQEVFLEQDLGKETQDKICALMKTFKKVVNQQTGNGMNTTKFHQCLHIMLQYIK